MQKIRKYNDVNIYKEELKRLNPDLSLISLDDKNEDIKLSKTIGIFKCNICGNTFKAKLGLVINNDFFARKFCRCNKYYTRIPLSSCVYYYYINKYYNDIVYEYKINNRFFDLYIPSKNIIVEIDGNIHENERSESIDKLKDKICIENNVKIIRIRHRLDWWYESVDKNVKILDIKTGLSRSFSWDEWISKGRSIPTIWKYNNYIIRKMLLILKFWDLDSYEDKKEICEYANNILIDVNSDTNNILKFRRELLKNITFNNIGGESAQQ